MKTLRFLGQSSLFHLVFLVTLAFILKGWHIGTTSIGGDECFSAFASQLSPNEIIDWLATGNNPPLWELILHFWTSIFGTSEISLRFPALIFNALTVIPIYWIGAQVFDKKAGFVAAILFIFSSIALFMAHESRVYSLVGFLATSSIAVFIYCIDNPSKKRYFVLLTFLNALLLYSHYITAWVIIIQFLLFLFSKDIRTKLRWKYIVHLFSTIVLFLPFLSVFFYRAKASSEGTWLSTVKSIDAFYEMLWNFSNQPFTTTIFIIILVFSLIKFIWKKFHISNPKSLYLHIFLWVPLLISFLISFKVGFFLDRYMYFLASVFYLSIVAVVNYLTKQRVQLKWMAYVFIMLLMIGTFTINSSFLTFSNYHQNTKDVVYKLKELHNENTITLICPKWFDKEVMYYWDREVFNTYRVNYKSVVAFKKPLNKQRIYPISESSEIPSLSETQQVIYLNHQCEHHCPENDILQTLEKNLKIKQITKVGYCEFYVFTKY